MSDRPRVQLFVTCLIEHFFPDAGLAAAKLLDRLGVEVTVPDRLTCCGQPAFNGGFRDEAREMARHTIDALSASDDPVVLPSGSCAEMIVHRYAPLFANDGAWSARAEALAARTYELSQFIVDVLGVEDVGARFPGLVAYHPSCHSLRGLGVDRQPRALLSRVAGLRWRDIPEADTCCGFGGLFSVKFGPVSAALLDRKLDAIEASGATHVVGTDVSCLMHIAGGLRRRGSTIRAAHLAEILAEGPS